MGVAKLTEESIDRLVSAFCKSQRLDKSEFGIRRSKAGNIVLENSDGKRYVLSPSGELVFGDSIPQTPQIQEKSDELRDGLNELTPYLRNTHVIPFRVLNIMRRNARKFEVLEEWQKGLVFAVSVTPTQDNMRIVVKFLSQGGSHAMVSFPDLEIGRPYPTSVAWRIRGYGDEIRHLQQCIWNAPYELTAFGEREIRNACSKAAREFYESIALPEEIMRLDNRRYSEMGRFLVESLQGESPMLEMDPSPSEWGDLSFNKCGFLQPWAVCCELGYVHMCYDLRDGHVWIDDGEMEQMRRFIRRKSHATEYDEIERALRERIPDCPMQFELRDDDSFSVSVSDLTQVNRVIDMGSYDSGQLTDLVDGIADEVMEGRRPLMGSWSDTRRLVGALLPMAIMEFLIDNQLTPVRERITKGVVIMAMRGAPLDTFVGMERSEFFEKMGEFSEDDIREAFEALRHARLIASRQVIWKEKTYINVFPVMPATDQFMRQSRAEAEDGTPVNEMTEWQLLGLLDGENMSRPYDKLADELPVLLAHPACYYAEPEKFMAYVRALPRALQDQVRRFRDMATDEAQHKMVTSLVAGLDSDLQATLRRNLAKARRQA